MIENLSSIIDIPKSLNSQTIIDVISKLNNFVKQDKISRLVINFWDTKFVTPGGLNPLLCYLRELPKVKKFEGLIVSNEATSVHNYISRMGFFTLLGMQDDYNLNPHSPDGRFKELVCFDKNTPETQLININEEVVKSFVNNSDNENYKNAIRWCLWELVDNARVHSNSNDCTLFAQKYPYNNLTEFCIADRGMGIRETMGCSDILDALQRALTKEGKGINSTGKGNGLHFTSELIKVDKSKKISMLSILSENGIVKIRSGQEPVIEKVETFWKGTIVTLSLNQEIQTNLEDVMGQTIYKDEDLPDFYI